MSVKREKIAAMENRRTNPMVKSGILWTGKEFGQMDTWSSGQNGANSPRFGRVRRPFPDTGKVATETVRRKPRFTRVATVRPVDPGIALPEPSGLLVGVG